MKNMGTIGGWNAKQRNLLRRCIKDGATIAYWNSDAHGRPANHTMDHIQAANWTARPCLDQSVKGPLYPCSKNALHATHSPHRWAGCRVWVVAMYNAVAVDDDKLAALKRVIIGEVLPEYAFSDSVGVKIGRKDLTNANLTRANLPGANLTNANLTGADLSYANLPGANLTNANLTGADLTGADLSYADLSYANLTRADLSYANLPSANLYGADLFRANLSRANLYGAYYPYGDVPNGWKRTLQGYIWSGKP